LTSVLINIDVQEGFNQSEYWGKRNNPDAEQKIKRLLEAWRSSCRPVIHVQHLSKDEASPLYEKGAGVNFKKAFMPHEGEPVFQKHVNSAFIGTDLEDYLHRHGYHDLVIVGLTTDHCVSTTTRMAGNLGFKVTLVGDATATFDRTSLDGHHYSADEIHRIHLVSLHGEFANVVQVDEVLKELLETNTHH
jgi:nicotinamidase-related amidase